jgi:hypothetical protein
LIKEKIHESKTIPIGPHGEFDKTLISLIQNIDELQIPNYLSQAIAQDNCGLTIAGSDYSSKVFSNSYRSLVGGDYSYQRTYFSIKIRLFCSLSISSA